LLQDIPKIASRRIGGLKRLLKLFGPRHKTLCGVHLANYKLNCHYIAWQHDLHRDQLSNPALLVRRERSTLDPAGQGSRPALRDPQFIPCRRKKYSTIAVESRPAACSLQLG